MTRVRTPRSAPQRPRRPGRPPVVAGIRRRPAGGDPATRPPPPLGHRHVRSVGGPPQLATITGNGSSLAPWNTSQGDSSTDRLPRERPAPDVRARWPDDDTRWGDRTQCGRQPRVRVACPYASGVVGRPDRWRTTAGPAPIAPRTPARRAVSRPGRPCRCRPYYFPHIVRNSDGSLTGYFDWRPKDADEAIVSPAPPTTARTGPTRARRWSRTPATARTPTSTTTARATRRCSPSGAHVPVHAAAGSGDNADVHCWSMPSTRSARPARRPSRHRAGGSRPRCLRHGCRSRDPFGRQHHHR